MFDFFHLSFFSIVLIFGFANFIRAGLMVDAKNIKKFNLEKILGITVISLFWFLYGIYRKIDGNLILLEAFALASYMMAFLAKLNSSPSNTLFGRPVPGHGKAESRWFKIIKYTILYILGFGLLAFVVFIILLIYG